MSASPTLVIYGDVLAEISAQVADFPRPGADAIVHDLAILPGGSAANCAVVAARLGASVKFVGMAGDDDFGQMVRRALATDGVDLSALRQADGPTATVIALVDGSGERTFLSFRGAAASVPYGPLPDAILRPGDWLHVSGYSFQTPHSRQTARSLMATAREAGATVSLDPSYLFARQVAAEYPDALTGLDYLFPSAVEAALMTGTEDPAQAAERLRAKGIETVLLKLGSEGCLIASEGGLSEVPAYPPEHVVDTTGAGDAFAGGFAAATLRGCSPEDAARVGNAAAAMVISEVGGQTAAPTLSELRAFAEMQDDARLLAAVGHLDEPGGR